MPPGGSSEQSPFVLHEVATEEPLSEVDQAVLKAEAEYDAIDLSLPDEELAQVEVTHEHADGSTVTASLSDALDECKNKGMQALKAQGPRAVAAVIKAEKLGKLTAAREQQAAAREAENPTEPDKQKETVKKPEKIIKQEAKGTHPAQSEKPRVMPERKIITIARDVEVVEAEPPIRVAKISEIQRVETAPVTDYRITEAALQIERILYDPRILKVLDSSRDTEPMNELVLAAPVPVESVTEPVEKPTAVVTVNHVAAETVRPVIPTAIIPDVPKLRQPDRLEAVVTDTYEAPDVTDRTEQEVVKKPVSQLQSLLDKVQAKWPVRRKPAFEHIDLPLDDERDVVTDTVEILKNEIVTVIAPEMAPVAVNVEQIALTVEALALPVYTSPECVEQTKQVVAIMPAEVQQAVIDLVETQEDPEMIERVQQIVPEIAEAAQRLHETVQQYGVESEAAQEIIVELSEQYEALLANLKLPVTDAAIARFIEQICSEAYVAPVVLEHEVSRYDPMREHLDDQTFKTDVSEPTATIVRDIKNGASIIMQRTVSFAV